MQKKGAVKARAGRAGFTLIELLVSIMIFSISMGVVSQLFTYSLKSERVLKAHAQLVNEMSYNMERISRGLRMAQKSAGTASCLAANENYAPTHVLGAAIHGIRFENINSSGQIDCVEYYMGYPYVSGKAALMERRLSNGVLQFDIPLTSPDVELVNFNISGTGWSQDDQLQPRVTINMKTIGNESQSLNIQTTVSQRNLDVRY